MNIHYSGSKVFVISIAFWIHVITGKHEMLSGNFISMQEDSLDSSRFLLRSRSQVAQWFPKWAAPRKLFRNKYVDDANIRRGFTAAFDILLIKMLS